MSQLTAQTISVAAAAAIGLGSLVVGYYFGKTSAAPSFNPAKVKLYYFAGLRARAEPLRIMYKYKKVNFEDILITFTEWPALQASHKFPFDQLPVLQVDGYMVAESAACARLAATQLGLISSDPFQAAVQDMLYQLGEEMSTLNPVVNSFITEESERSKRIATASKKLPFLAEQLHKAGEKFFGGESPLYSDFQIWHHVDLLLLLSINCLDQYPALKAWYRRVAGLPGVKEYLAERCAPRRGSEE
eukprot:gb/GEZN01014698.1/.p1 GENE.gb/GEZN01014698.1/~~gb/GEZN01014698.1/.p1  ORF type:complete len:245 (-),score=30.50 gb/GEZN01014698.1/:149-883(-)